MFTQDSKYKNAMELAVKLYHMAEEEEDDEKVFAYMADAEKDDLIKICCVYAYGIGELQRENKSLLNMVNMLNEGK